MLYFVDVSKEQVTYIEDTHLTVSVGLTFFNYASLDGETDFNSVVFECPVCKSISSFSQNLSDTPQSYYVTKLFDYLKGD